MLDLGLSFLIDQKDMCSVLTTVNIPSYIDVDIFRKKLREKSIIIYEGKGCFKNRVFQVGNIGEFTFVEIRFFLDSLREILQAENGSCLTESLLAAVSPQTSKQENVHALSLSR